MKQLPQMYYTLLVFLNKIQQLMSLYLEIMCIYLTAQFIITFMSAHVTASPSLTFFLSYLNFPRNTIIY